MSPRDLSRPAVQERLRLLQELLEDLDVLGAVDAERLEHDRITRRAVERILTQLVDLSTDINQHIGSISADRIALDYRASFQLAANAGAIPGELAEDLAPSVGLRNVLTHEYVGVDLGTVARSVPLARELYGTYVRSVARWLRDYPAAD